MQQAIAILDSGVGGLTVAKEVMRQLPQEKVLYFGDTARAPYGPRPASEVVLFTEQVVDFLMQFQPKMIIIACNTATAVALQLIRARVSVPVVGVIHPGARAAIKTTRSGVVGVIGTEGTVSSGAYEYALTQIKPHIQVVSHACPTLVPIVEQGLFDGEDVCREVELALAPIRQFPIDCLILGCTHYPFLAPVIAGVMGEDVALISSADETAREVSAILGHRNMLAQGDDEPEHHFFCSGDPALFGTIAEKWLEHPVHVMPVKWQVSNFV